MSNVKCFLIHPTSDTFQYLRRYSFGACHCNNGNYHNAMVAIEDGKVDKDGIIRLHNDQILKEKYKDQWPKHCECGYEFKTDDESQIFKAQKYTDEAGNLYTLENAPVGAMWFATWYEEIPMLCGTDGKAIIVKTPAGDWHIDGKASKCGSPDDHVHKCWCRHGEAPNLTVDKNGVTCTAGAGSIQIHEYHGFLTNGELTCCPD